MTGLDDVVVRQVERADLLDVLRIERASFSQPWPYAAFESFVDEPAFLVAARGNEILGYVVADVMPNHGNDIGHIKDLAVHPDARGEGLGRRLLQQALSAMLLAGAAVVKLEVRVSNEPALSLYREVGFEPARRIPRYYADGEDAFIMVQDLSDWIR
ncbi:ribosomal protein S18-alanine N-acetyltransferase [Haloferax sp. DFSO60]|uniref:ribosomal protein S18-alanine N-acetyltransferase n=1 Tax=Haloferax sp. DFSO60 TaxID=3388652 RepID=UPI00397BD6A1